jgi:hypothetical protein
MPRSENVRRFKVQILSPKLHSYPEDHHLNQLGLSGIAPSLVSIDRRLHHVLIGLIVTAILTCWSYCCRASACAF